MYVHRIPSKGPNTSQSDMQQKSLVTTRISCWDLLKISARPAEGHFLVSEILLGACPSQFQGASEPETRPISPFAKEALDRKNDKAQALTVNKTMEQLIQHHINGSNRGMTPDDDDDASIVSAGGTRRSSLSRLLKLKREKDAQTPNESRRSSLSAIVGQGMKNTLMAPVVASRFAVNVGVKSTQAVANATVKSTQAVANATVKSTQAVANATVKSTQAVAHVTTKTVKAGAKGVVGGGRAIMDGTGAVVGYGGKTMLSGAKGVVKMTKKPWKSFSKNRSQSKWEKGIDFIDSLLQPDSATYQAMTQEQRVALGKVKKLLLKGSTTNSNLHKATEAEKIAHIPRELLKEQKRSQKSSVASPDGEDPATSKSYILQEFAGVRNENLLQNLSDQDTTTNSLNEDEFSIPSEVEDASETEEKAPAPNKETPTPVRKLRNHNLSHDQLMFVPPEFANLSTDIQLVLCDMLSLESIAKWGYDIFKLDELTNGNSLLFISWAIVASPHAQNAMEAACGRQSIDHITKGGYSFTNEFGIVPSTLCNYVGAVQAEYHKENPYHNAIHAADVVQTLHSLIQMHGTDESDPRDLLAILLSAIVHDMDHPGNTNSFHTNLQTELAIMYNDSSILENWHVARAFACMLGLSLESVSRQQYEALAGPNRPSERNILTNVDKEDFTLIRNRMIEAVLHTDMTKHFAMVNSMKGLLLQGEEESEDGAESMWKVLMFMLHLADISSQAKPDPLFRHWTVRCMDEFFDQGELEAQYGLPISPNCNRDTTNVAKSQTGFMKFVVGPAYEVLGGFIPALEEEVLPLIEANLNTWISES